MASTAIKSQGTSVFISDGKATPAWKEIGNVKQISGMEGGTSNDIEVTNLQSTAKEYRSGLKDSGELSLTLDWNDSDVGQAELKASLDGSLLRKFYIKIKIDDTPTYKYASFQGTVKSLPKEGGVDGVWTSNASIRVSGDYTYGTSSPTA